MNARRTLLAVAATASLLPGSAEAQDIIMGRWSILLQGGTDLELSGDVMTDGSGPLLGRPATVQATSFEEAYDPSVRGQVILGYGVSPHSEILMCGTYYKMTSNQFQPGTVGGAPFLAELSTYKEWGIELGYRRYLSVQGSVKPYLALSGGMRVLELTSADFEVPEFEIALIDYPYWNGSRMGVFGAELGFLYNTKGRVLLGLEVGIRYQTKPSRSPLPFPFEDSDLENINATGSRWSVPLLVSLGYRF